MKDSYNGESKFEFCIYSKPFINKLEQSNNNGTQIDIEYIKKAIFYAKKYHGNQLRKSGEPYYSHPVEVASMIADYFSDTDMLVIAILHDVIEDTDCTSQMIACFFTEKIAQGVEALTRKGKNTQISAAENLKLLYNQKKKGLLIIKLFDRLHNMRTLHVKSPESIERITNETIHSFLIIAVYLGLADVAQELFTRCMKFSHCSGAHLTSLHATLVDLHGT